VKGLMEYFNNAEIMMIIIIIIIIIIIVIAVFLSKLPELKLRISYKPRSIYNFRDLE
jgi:hypothetical protein